jgi:polyphosphate kinase
MRELKFSGPDDIYEVNDMLGTRDFMQLLALDRPELKDVPHEPVDHPRLAAAKSMFEELDANGPMLVKYPYHSFDGSVTRFLREAVRDPDVLAIKTTVYRTSEESELIPLLIQAVTQGKQVAVVVELQARFDEAANIRWANRLEEAGIHVSYGVVGYKTHTKAMLVLRKLPSGKLRRYVHVGTGNYNSVTARLYADLGLLSSEQVIAKDATELFNLMTSGSLSGRHYEELLVAPLQMKQALLDKIRREIAHHVRNGNGIIQLKTNALEDPDIVRALYEATSAGVDLDLIVRDSCRLRPGIPGLSETARVISILGRFLEHSRIYYFHNGGDEEYYIGSADLMTRNLVSRVEALTPVRSLDLQAELRELLDLQLVEKTGAWEMNSSGNYIKCESGDEDIHCQRALIEKTNRNASAGDITPGKSAL